MYFNSFHQGSCSLTGVRNMPCTKCVHYCIEPIQSYTPLPCRNASIKYMAELPQDFGMRSDAQHEHVNSALIGHHIRYGLLHDTQMTQAAN